MNEQTMNLDNIIQQLVEQRFAIIDNVLPDEVIQNLRQEIMTADEENQLLYAKISQQKLQENTIRSDVIQWIDESQPSNALKTYLTFLEQLRLAVNQEFQLGLFQHEIHYSLYRTGSFYKKHVDQFAHNTSRQLSFILYLNEQWQRDDGGSLVLYDKNNVQLAEVSPQANRFICFFSDLPHEVLVTNRTRLSITGWFKIRN